MPGKVFEYLAAGKPILCVGPAGSDADNLLRECGAGQALPYEDAPLMHQTLAALATRWQQHPNLDLPALGNARYSRRGLTEALAGLVRE